MPEKKAAGGTEAKKAIQNGSQNGIHREDAKSQEKNDKRTPADEIIQDEAHWQGEQKQDNSSMDEATESFDMAIVIPSKREPSITTIATPGCLSRCEDITVC